MPITFVSLKRGRWDARTATNLRFHYAGFITVKTTEQVMNPDGGKKRVLIRFPSPGDSGVSAAVLKATSSKGTLRFLPNFG
jgi:hypothetical protein